MKISKVIELLQYYMDKYGDVTVLCNDIDYCSGPVETITAQLDADGVVYAVGLD